MCSVGKWLRFVKNPLNAILVNVRCVFSHFGWCPKVTSDWWRQTAGTSWTVNRQTQSGASICLSLLSLVTPPKIAILNKEKQPLFRKQFLFQEEKKNLGAFFFFCAIANWKFHRIGNFSRIIVLALVRDMVQVLTREIFFMWFDKLQKNGNLFFMQIRDLMMVSVVHTWI